MTIKDDPVDLMDALKASLEQAKVRRLAHEDSWPGPPAPHEADDVDLDDDERSCAHRGDGEDCECNGNDQPQREED